MDGVWRCRVRYGNLCAAGNSRPVIFTGRRACTGAQLRRYGKNVADWDLSFRTLCDFKELRWQKEHIRQLPRYQPYDDL